MRLDDIKVIQLCTEDENKVLEFKGLVPTGLKEVNSEELESEISFTIRGKEEINND